MKTFGVIRNKPDFAQVYEQEYSYVYNYIYMQVMHRENTEDLVSDIFMRAMSHYDSFRDYAHGSANAEYRAEVDEMRKLAEQAKAQKDEETRNKLLATEQSFRESASSNGVREMRLSEFLIRMGYRETAAIYNSGETKNPIERREIGGERSAPIYYSSKVGPTASEGVPYRTPQVEADSVDTYFRKRQPK